MGATSQSPILLLARRFLLSKSKDGFLSLITWVSVFGVFLGVLALCLVTSVINGFEGELSRVITGMNGDVILYSRGEPLRDPEIVEHEIRRLVPELQAVTESFVAELMLSGPHGVSGAILQGFEPSRLGTVMAIPERVTQGRMPHQAGEIILGTVLAEKLNVKLGDEVRVIAPMSGGENSPPRVTRATIVGLFKMGMYDYDSKFALMPLEAVQTFLEQQGKVTTFHLKLRPETDARKVSRLLSQSFEYPFRAKDWGQLNRNLFYAIQLEKVVIAIILTVIIVVAAFNVVSTLMMMIHDKTKEISILKAMGFRPSQSFQLFCFIGLGIGIVGTLFGLLGSLGLGWLLEKTRLVQLPSEIYYIGFLPVVFKWSELGLIVGIAILISFLATLYPAWRVSRGSPLEGLRYE